MIKILKEGIKKPTKTIYTANCSHCSCEFEFEAQDTISIGIHQNGEPQFIRIQCPYCKKEIFLTSPYVETREEEVEE